MPAQDAQPPVRFSACSSMKELKQTRHRPSLYRSADIGMLVPDHLYPVHHRSLKVKNYLHVVICTFSKFARLVQENHLFKNLLKMFSMLWDISDLYQLQSKNTKTVFYEGCYFLSELKEE